MRSFKRTRLLKEATRSESYLDFERESQMLMLDEPFDNKAQFFEEHGIHGDWPVFRSSIVGYGS